MKKKKKKERKKVSAYAAYRTKALHNEHVIFNPKPTRTKLVSFPSTLHYTNGKARLRRRGRLKNRDRGRRRSLAPVYPIQARVLHHQTSEKPLALSRRLGKQEKRWFRRKTRRQTRVPSHSFRGRLRNGRRTRALAALESVR